MTRTSPALQLIDAGESVLPPLPLDAQRSVADFIHVAANHNLALADRKAGILLTLVSAALLFLLERNGLSPLHSGSTLSALVWLFMMLSLTFSAVTAFATVMPRVIRESNELYLWAVIGSHNQASQWVVRLQHLSEDDLAVARLYHCHALARICVVKYRLLRMSMTAAAGGLIGAALFIAF